MKPRTFMSFVRGRKIMLTRYVLNSIFGIDTPSSVSICTKKLPIDLEGFLVLDQLKVIRDLPGLLEYVPHINFNGDIYGTLIV